VEISDAFIEEKEYQKEEKTFRENWEITQISVRKQKSTTRTQDASQLWLHTCHILITANIGT